jgi:hypothetical protein
MFDCDGRLNVDYQNENKTRTSIHRYAGVNMGGRGIFLLQIMHTVCLINIVFC